MYVNKLVLSADIFVVVITTDCLHLMPLVLGSQAEFTCDDVDVAQWSVRALSVASGS